MTDQDKFIAGPINPYAFFAKFDTRPTLSRAEIREDVLVGLDREVADPYFAESFIEYLIEQKKLTVNPDGSLSRGASQPQPPRFTS